MKYLAGILLIICNLNLWGQGSHNVYNRLNYRHFEWKILEGRDVKVYVPDGYDSLGLAGEAYFDDALKDLVERTGVSLQNKPNLIIYPSVLALSESNIGGFETSAQNLPLVYTKGERIVVSFRGSHKDLNTQIRKGCVKMVWDDIKDKQPAASEEESPTWFREGFFSYFADSWSFDSELSLKSKVLKLAPAGWNQLAGQAPELSGRAFCYFLEQRFGDKSLKRIFFQIKSGKGFSQSVTLITKAPLPNLEIQCFDFYLKRFGLHHNNPALSPVKKSAKIENDTLFRLASPDGKNTLLAIDRMHRQRIFLTTTEAKKEIKVAEQPLPPGISSEEFFQPMALWADNHSFVYITSKRGRIAAIKSGLRGQLLRRISVPEWDGLLSFKKLDNENWIINGFRNGRSDIGILSPGRLRYRAILDGERDNLEMDVFRTKNEGALITYRSEPYKDFGAGRNHLKQDEKGGIFTMIKARGTDSMESRLLLDDSSSLQWHHPHFINDSIIETNLGTITVLKENLRPENEHIREIIFDSLKSNSPWVRDWIQRSASESKSEKIHSKEKEEAKQHQSAFKDVFHSIGGTSDNRDSVVRYNKYAHFEVQNRFKAYHLQLFKDYFGVKLDNELYFNRFQPTQSYLGNFTLPQLGAMAKGGWADIFENHRLEIGYKIPVDFNGSSYIMSYYYLPSLIDWHIDFYRNVQSLKIVQHPLWMDNNGKYYPPAAKVKTYIFNIGMKWPINYLSSVNAQSLYQQDKTVFLANDPYSLTFPSIKQRWDISEISYERHSVNFYDESGTNRNPRGSGWEFEFINSLFIPFVKQNSIVMSSQINSTYRCPVTPFLSGMLRLQAGISQGAKSVAFVMGGVSNNLTPLINDTLALSQKAPYNFLSLITPLRGYGQNSILGNQYVLTNIELASLPVSQFIPQFTRIPILRGLYTGAFCDLAESSGKSVDNLRNQYKFLVSFGVSLGTKLAGYPLKIDLGWPGNFKHAPLAYFYFDL